MRFVIPLVLTILATATVEARADLTAKQARKLITRTAGIELPSGAVRVKRISSTDSSAEVLAEIQAVFRLSTNREGFWRVVEVRVAQDRWESLTPAPLISWETDKSLSKCDAPDLGSHRPATEPSAKRARCLLASFLGVQLPSDAVRIKSVSPFEVPLASHPSALAESIITAEFRFSRDRNGWAVTSFRTGELDWISPEKLVATVNEAKRKQAAEEMESIARALAKFRSQRQSYVSSDSHAVLIDYLSPRFLSRVIRVDPWQEPYRYLGDRDNFTLRSLGPDRKENTADDIVVSAPL
jgi:hypothetical protein